MRIKISEKQREEIARAVEAAEKDTSGEIATAVIRESSNYILFEFIFMIVFGLIAAVALLIFGSQWQAFWEKMLWGLEAFQLSSLSLGAVFLVMGMAYLIANTPFVDRLIVPKRVMARMVSDKARLHFFNAGLTNTDERTAILIFVSLTERRVELIADKGISEKIQPEVWQSIVDTLVQKITGGDISGGLVEAVTACGEILKKEFPQKGKGKNQLSDSVEILED